MCERQLLGDDDQITVQLPIEATTGLPEEAINLMCEYKLLHNAKGECAADEGAADAAHQLVIEYDKVIRGIRDEIAEVEAKANHRTALRQEAGSEADPSMARRTGESASTKDA